MSSIIRNRNPLSIKTDMLIVHTRTNKSTPCTPIRKRRNINRVYGIFPRHLFFNFENIQQSELQSPISNKRKISCPNKPKKIKMNTSLFFQNAITPEELDFSD